TVYASGFFFGGACSKASVVRFFPDGTSDVLQAPSEEGVEINAMDVGSDGRLAVTYDGKYNFAEEDGVVWFGDDGTQSRADLADLVAQATAVGPGQGTLTVGNALETEEPVSVAYLAEGDLLTTILPNLQGMPTTPTRVEVSENGIGYVSAMAGGFGVQTFGIIRLDNALPVATSQDEPSSTMPLLARHGPNPLRANTPLRLTLGEPVDLALYDLLGRRVAAWDAVPPGDFEATLPTRLAAGLYVLRAEGEDAAATLRVTILR
ncbi:MAG: T9SS type A sorting domain-containing protein, partial [Bacteroidota bacterium]